MKKYLIAGTLALICNVFMSSCGEDLGNYNSLEEEKKAQFAQNFEKFYGQISSTQDWGFGDAALSAVHAKTRSVNVNGNLWYQNWNRPVNVTADEAAKVLAEFSKKRENQTNTITINWNNYWVHQVHQSNNSYYDGFGQSTGDIHASMNKIIAYNTSGSSYYYEHVNNFNNGTNTTVYTDDETKQQYIGTTLMLDMGTNASNTNQFGYHNTRDSKDHFEYYIIAGADIDASLAGYYYVGFDFCASPSAEQANNKNMYVGRDWIYNDWIVRISPATSSGSGSSTGGGISTDTDGTEVYTKQHVLVHKWVFCEDLGSSSNRKDYDYNDLVFDARIVDEYKVIKNADGTESDYPGDNTHKYYAKITPLAAGGELAMWFDQDNTPVHSLFAYGVANNVLINTCNPDQEISMSHMEGLSAKTFIYNFNSLNDATINNITIFVRYSSSTYDLTAEEGEAPHKLCVPPGTRWAYERTDIKEAYTGFSDYVVNRIDPWNDGVEANLYPLDGVPDSLKIDQYGQYFYIKDSANSTENTTYTVTPSASETSIWTGETNFVNYSNSVEIAASNFAEVGDGTIVRFYGVANSSFNVKAIYLANTWTDVDLGDTRWVTGNDKCNYENTALNSYIELKLNATTAERFKSQGMRVYGNNFKLLSVTYDNSNQPTPAAEETLWTGPLDFGWSNKISLAYGAFMNKGLKAGSIIRFYMQSSATSYYGSANDWNFKIFTGYEQGWTMNDCDKNGYNTDISKGYFDYVLTSDDAQVLAMEKNLGWTPSSSLQIQGEKFILNKITLIP